MWQPTETLETNGAISDVPLSLSLSLRFLSLVVIQAQMNSADLYMMSLCNLTIIYALGAAD